MAKHGQEINNGELIAKEIAPTIKPVVADGKPDRLNSCSNATYEEGEQHRYRTTTTPTTAC